MKVQTILIFDSDHVDETGLGLLWIKSPTMTEVETAVRSINGQNRDSLKLLDENDGFMAIGCGYHCNVLQSTPPAMFRLINPQSSSPDAVDRVSFEIALEAALWFAQFGTRKETLEWEQTC